MAQKILLSKLGINALTATDPNDFIFNSDYNTFKIVGSGNLFNQNISGDPTTLEVTHGISSTIPVVYALIRLPDGRVYLPGSVEPATSTGFFRYWSVEVDSSKIYFNVHKVLGADFTVDIFYMIFESTISGSGVTVSSGMRMRISKPTYNVLTETLLDRMIYDSQYDTLKYYAQGNASLNITAGDVDGVTTIAHNLGYKPLFMSYLELDFSLGAGKWSQVPFNLTDFWGYSTITSSVDATNIYFHAATTDPFGFGDIDLNFTYKIFRNDTGI